jgi:hypothetical protein
LWSNGATTSTITGLAPGTWRHVVITKAGNLVRFFFDGVFQQELGTESGQDVTSSDLFLGWNGSSGHNAGEQFFGGLDDIRIYSRAMSDAEVQSLYEYESNVGLTNTAPTITAQPAATNVFVGDSATLTVSVVGTRPLAYQWRKDGGNMNGKTSATLTLANVTLTDSGDYTVVVTNDFGSVTSAVARVTVTATRPPTQAGVFDLREDWSDTSNPNGVWTLLSGTDVVPRADGTSIDRFSPVQRGWGPPPIAGGLPIPFWFKSTSKPLSVHDWKSGDIVVHTQDDASGSGQGPANVIWTSPLSGKIDISGGVWEGRDVGDRGGGFRGKRNLLRMTGYRLQSDWERHHLP